MYHGSPYGGLQENFDKVKPPVFFTFQINVAKQYATLFLIGGKEHPMGSAQRLPPGVTSRDPTIYKVEVKPGRIIDMREVEHQDLYMKARRQLIESDPDLRASYPPVTDKEGFLTAGFLMSSTGLPSFGWSSAIMGLLRDPGHRRLPGQSWQLPVGVQPMFNSIWIDEGPQGISLALYDVQGRTQIISTEPGSVLRRKN